MSSRPRIGDLGLIGDTRTAALVDTRGGVVWLCLPHFDGEPVFAALVAGERGGLFLVGPSGDAEVTRRHYRRGSTVLETTWRVEGAELVLTEGMVAEVEGALLPTSCLVRRIEARGAAVECRLRFDPRFGVKRCPPRTRATGAGLVCVGHGVALSYTADRDLGVAPG
ncbi:MAG TPA: trehalase-like domain-containing protein, partial [Acidimicrobiales bacterium]|nr:trehalase-like domain-containing protein [Acidimicrobiales bacterium]